MKNTYLILFVLFITSCYNVEKDRVLHHKYATKKTGKDIIEIESEEIMEKIII